MRSLFSCHDSCCLSLVVTITFESIVNGKKGFADLRSQGGYVPKDSLGRLNASEENQPAGVAASGGQAAGNCPAADGALWHSGSTASLPGRCLPALLPLSTALHIDLLTQRCLTQGHSCCKNNIIRNQSLHSGCDGIILCKDNLT